MIVYSLPVVSGGMVPHLPIIAKETTEWNKGTWQEVQIGWIQRRKSAKRNARTTAACAGSGRHFFCARGGRLRVLLHSNPIPDRCYSFPPKQNQAIYMSLGAQLVLLIR